MAEKKKLSLLDKMEQEKKQEEAENNASIKVELSSGRKSSVLDITDSSNKNKQISAKVNGKVYDIFTQINKAQGISNNSALNMVISKYVRENKGILDEDIFI